MRETRLHPRCDFTQQDRLSWCSHAKEMLLVCPALAPAPLNPPDLGSLPVPFK